MAALISIDSAKGAAFMRLVKAVIAIPAFYWLVCLLMASGTPGSCLTVVGVTLLVVSPSLTRTLPLLLHRGPRITIDGVGIVDHTNPFGRILWSDIESVIYHEDNRPAYSPRGLVLNAMRLSMPSATLVMGPELRNHYLERGGRWRRATNFGLSMRAGKRGIAIDLGSIDAEPLYVKDEMARRVIVRRPSSRWRSKRQRRWSRRAES